MSTAGASDVQIDLEVLKENFGDDYMEMFVELFDVFMETAPEEIEAVTKAIGDGDSGGLERVCHALKAECRSLGAIEMGDLAEQLETMGREGRASEAADLAPRVQSLFEQTRGALQALASSASPA